VVSSPLWNNGAIASAGAVTWGNGTSGVTGAVSAANSLVGSRNDDRVGTYILGLSNGNYIVRSPGWDRYWGFYLWTADAGAVTWGDGASGITGYVSVSNSLVGSTDGNYVGIGGIALLSNGNYVVSSPYWDNKAIVDVGAVTWGNGTSGITGTVSVFNSLVGSTANDYVGEGGMTALSNGDYVIKSPDWDNASIVDSGAVTWGFGSGGIHGSISAQNSVLGLAAGGGAYMMVYQYDPTNRQLVVGRPADNIVTLFRLPYVFLPVVSK